MTPTEIDILLHAIGQVENGVKQLSDDLAQFRSYADQTYVRKDTVEAQKDTRETFWKRHDRILARIALVVSAASILVTVLFSTLHK